MAHWKTRLAPVIQHEITVPGDKSISHRSIILAALSNGTCVIRGFLPSEDCLCTMNAMRALGVQIEQPEPTTVIVHGTRGKLRPAAGPIDCGNSGTSIRLLSGVLAAQPFKSVLTGDESLSKRPMKRVIDPLSLMGATLRGQGEKGTPPLIIEGRQLTPIHYDLPVASAQVKSAVLLAGMLTRGRTSVTEPMQSRDHTEQMMRYFLVNPKTDGLTVAINGEQTPESRDFTVPGDISSAAFWLAAAAAQPGSHLIVKNVGLNKTRTGVLGVLIRMGAQVREVIEEVEEGELAGSVEIKGARLRATVICGKEIPNVIDEIPILAVMGALAKGRTIIADAQELRVKETDRIAAVAKNLRLMGAQVTEREDGMEIEGGIPLRGARLESFGDHRIAMAFAIAGMFAEGETTINGVECVATSYPGFERTMELMLRAKTDQQIPVVGALPMESEAS